MTKSEILLVMIGGMATVAGGVLAAYIGFLGGEDEASKTFLQTFTNGICNGSSWCNSNFKNIIPQTDSVNTDVAFPRKNWIKLIRRNSKWNH